MEQVRITATALCATVAIIALVRFISPSAKLSGVLKPVLVCFFAMMLLTSFRGLSEAELGTLLPGEEAPQSEESFVQSSIANAAAAAVKEQIERVLSAENYSYGDIDISMNISEEEGISINEITITGVDAKHARRVHDILKKQLGLEVGVQTVA